MKTVSSKLASQSQTRKTTFDTAHSFGPVGKFYATGFVPRMHSIVGIDRDYFLSSRYAQVAFCLVLNSIFSCCNRATTLGILSSSEHRIPALIQMLGQLESN